MKDENARLYDAIADKYERQTAASEFRDAYLNPLMDEFLGSLSGKRVADVGSGPGVDALRMASKGYAVTCIDSSEQMCVRCAAKGLTAAQRSMTDLNCFFNETIHGVWMYASLLHLPKNSAPIALREAHRVLMPKGKLFIGVKEGFGECWEEIIQEKNGKKRGYHRYMARYQAEELEAVLSERFELQRKTSAAFPSRSGDSMDMWLHYLCTRRQ